MVRGAANVTRTNDDIFVMHGRFAMHGRHRQERE
jgi:hypothetical protein